jgi:DNA-binding sugar fermentation-stimulating protein
MRFVIYKDISQNILIKINCYSIKKKKRFFRFEKLNGDIPVCTLKDKGNIEEVINNRGKAYGLRNALKYRKTKREKLNDYKFVRY